MCEVPGSMYVPEAIILLTIGCAKYQVVCTYVPGTRYVLLFFFVLPETFGRQARRVLTSLGRAWGWSVPESQYRNVYNGLGA